MILFVYLYKDRGLTFTAFSFNMYGIKYWWTFLWTDLRKNLQIMTWTGEFNLTKKKKDGWNRYWLNKMDFLILDTFISNLP